MNERDSEQVLSMFLAGGDDITKDEAEADVILINTCSVREKAELKALGKMGLLCSRPTAKPWVVYGFMGCMCQSRAASLFRDVPRLDIVTGTQQYHNVYNTGECATDYFTVTDGVLTALQQDAFWQSGTFLRPCSCRAQ